MQQKIALSGGIGSGKTTVRKMLEALGASTICADEIVHELQAPGMPLLEEIAQAFGPEVLREDGSLDRVALGERVFSDPEARAELGRIMHPPVISEMMRRTEQALQGVSPLVVLDIPLFFEGKKSGTGSAAATDYDASVLVWVPEGIQIERVRARDQCSIEEARRRVAAQMPIDEKRKLASHTIDNSGERDETLSQVEALWQLLVARGGS
jgi:dephospho-CoA kinase